jgi:hypothetical protein
VGFNNNTSNTTGVDIEKEAGAKMITESRKEFYVRQGITEVMLGREKKEAINYFQIADMGTISKYHSKISWDSVDSQYKISNFSKNKITVNNEALMNTDAPRALKNLTTIQISKVKIIFLLPNNNSEKRFEMSKEMLE